MYLNSKKETKGVLYRSGDATCFFFQSQSPFFYQIINKTKLFINFQKQSPWNIKESRNLNAIFIYNTPCLFSFYLIIYLFIYSFCRICVSNDPLILFQKLLSRNYWWKNTSVSKVLIYYEIESFTTKSTCTLKLTPFFDFYR